MYYERFCLSPDEEKSHIPSHFDCERNSEYGVISHRPSGVGQANKAGFYNHMKYSELLKLIDADSIKGYTIFCVVRNPYDVAVSHYFYSMSKLLKFDSEEERNQFTFEKYLLTGKIPKNTSIYAENGFNTCTHYIRYESLKDDVLSLNRVLGIPEIYSTEIDSYFPHEKADIRPKNGDESDKYAYRQYYNEETIRLVSDICREEIEYFGYTF